MMSMITYINVDLAGKYAIAKVNELHEIQESNDQQQAPIDTEFLHKT